MTMNTTKHQKGIGVYEEYGYLSRGSTKDPRRDLGLVEKVYASILDLCKDTARSLKDLKIARHQTWTKLLLGTFNMYDDTNEILDTKIIGFKVFFYYSEYTFDEEEKMREGSRDERKFIQDLRNSRAWTQFDSSFGDLQFSEEFPALSIWIQKYRLSDKSYVNELKSCIEHELRHMNNHIANSYSYQQKKYKITIERLRMIAPLEYASFAEFDDPFEMYRSKEKYVTYRLKCEEFRKAFKDWFTNDEISAYLHNVNAELRKGNVDLTKRSIEEILEAPDEIENVSSEDVRKYRERSVSVVSKWIEWYKNPSIFIESVNDLDSYQSILFAIECLQSYHKEAFEKKLMKMLCDLYEIATKETLSSKSMFPDFRMANLSYNAFIGENDALVLKMNEIGEMCRRFICTLFRYDVLKSLKHVFSNIAKLSFLHKQGLSESIDNPDKRLLEGINSNRYLRTMYHSGSLFLRDCVEC